MAPWVRNGDSLVPRVHKEGRKAGKEDFDSSCIPAFLSFSLLKGFHDSFDIRDSLFVIRNFSLILMYK
jgi:hypothetical protein